MKLHEIFGAGYLVSTSTGRLGRTMHKDKRVNDKQIVYLFTKESIPLKQIFELDKDGNVSQLLCTPDKITLKGFIN